MIISCMKRGLLPDFSLCYPEEDNIVMIINEDTELVFHNIYSCQQESFFNFKQFLIKTSSGGDGLTKTKIEDRLVYFYKHKRTIINRFLSRMTESVFFDSIEMEALENYFGSNKLSCHISIRYKSKNVSLVKLKETNKALFYKVASVLKAYNVCQIVEIAEYEKLKNNLMFKRLDYKSFSLGFVVSLLIPAIIFAIKRGD